MVAANEKVVGEECDACKIKNNPNSWYNKNPNPFDPKGKGRRCTCNQPLYRDFEGIIRPVPMYPLYTPEEEEEIMNTLQKKIDELKVAKKSIGESSKNEEYGYEADEEALREIEAEQKLKDDDESVWLADGAIRDILENEGLPSEDNFLFPVVEMEYPELKKLEDLVLSTGEVYNPGPPRELVMRDAPPGYAPASSSSVPETYLSASGGTFKWKDPMQSFSLPSAQNSTGALFVMPADFGEKVFDRWKSVTLNFLADKTFPTADDKLIYIENLLGENEKIVFQTWRMAYPEAYEQMKAQALGTNGTNNVLAQIRRVFFLEDPSVGTTGMQDRAYSALKSLVCHEMDGAAIRRYTASYYDLAAKSGRMWTGPELSDDFFTKLPSGLGERVREAYMKKFPGNTIGVTSRIAFTHQYLEDVC